MTYIDQIICLWSILAKQKKLKHVGVRYILFLLLLQVETLTLFRDDRHADKKKDGKKAKNINKFKKGRKSGSKSTKNRQKETKKKSIRKEKKDEKNKSYKKAKKRQSKTKSRVDGAAKKKRKKANKAKNADDPDKKIYVKDECFNVSIHKVLLDIEQMLFMEVDRCFFLIC